MMSVVSEWLNLLVRWLHVIAGIMWIGDSFLFMWLDSHLSPPSKPREGDVAGELWMTHSGAFYEVIKRRTLQQSEIPKTLYWFKWESYSTFLSGFLLLGIVYWMGGASFLIDRAVCNLTVGQAIASSLGMLLGGVVVYDGLCRTPLVRSNQAFAAVGLVLIAGVAYVLTHLFSGRAAFLHVGAMLGTIMASSVFLRIIPSAKALLAATQAGGRPDPALGVRAKQRSIHNHYLTLPVLFMMLSNHFPSTYGNKHAWLVLTLLVVFGVALKIVMIRRTDTPILVLTAMLLSTVGVIALTKPAHSQTDLPTAKVSFAKVQEVVLTRCVPCHAAQPTHPAFTVAPKGVMLDSPTLMKQHAAQMYIQAVETRVMPLGNLTNITEEERGVLGAWVKQGAPLQ